MTTKFRSKNNTLADQAIKALKAERPMTLRQLYYRLISAGYLANAQKEYKRLGSVMTRLREGNIIPRTWLVDHVRSRLKPSSWSGLADFAETVRDAYRKDLWDGMPHHVEVFVEKDAVAGTIQPVTHKYDVALGVIRGYSSVSFAGEIADEWREIDKPIYAYYVGDFDPSGFDLERDLREKLQRYSGRTGCIDPVHGEVDDTSFGWDRLGVRAGDFAAFDLVRLPVKTKDKRSAGFIRQHGHDCAEVDALPPSELRERVEQAILSHIDGQQWASLLAVEKVEQQSLAQIVKGWERKAKPNLDSVSTDDASNEEENDR